MNENEILPDDPRLTAYAFDEMEPAERAQFEQLLQQDAAARRQVEEITALGRQLDRALAEEPLPAMPAGARPQALLPAHDSLPRVSRFPYYWVSGLAAACFAVGFVVWQAQYRAPGPTRLIKVELQAPEPPAAAPATAADGPAPVALPPAKPESDFAVVVLPPEAEQARGAKAGETIAAAEAFFKDVAKQPLPENNEKIPAPARAADADPASAVAAAPMAAGTPVEEKAESGALALAPMPKEGPMHFSVAAQSAPAPAAPPVVGGTVGEIVQLQAFTVSADQRKMSRGAARRGNGAGEATSRKMGYLSEQEARAPDAGGYVGAFNTEAYDRLTDNPFVAVAHHNFSTFSIDVDTASYANVRRFLQQGQRPPRDAVRIEELVNYFPYDYAEPKDRDMPFAAAMEVASAPWKPEHRLVRIGLKGREIPAAERPAANLVFLIDVSGSMRPQNRLPLVKRSLQLLVEQLRPDDRVALAVYAGSAGLVLPSTRAAEKREILAAIERLEAGGSTNGAMGIQLAYDVAKANFIPGGVNRLILCTDGDFNVGVTNRGDLVRLVEEKAKGGVFLTVLGFGMGNYKDATLEQLADRGNGNHGYVDSLREAQKLLVEQAGGTLVTIAKDVKVQVDFNPAQVQAYRLIGYENRLLRKEDFNNDHIDAGEIGAAHTVTALFEVVPVGVDWKPDSTVDSSKYQIPGAERGRRTASPEMLTLKLRYKEPDGVMSRLREFPLVDGGARFEEASMDFRFAASVAAWGMILRDSPYKGTATLADVTAWASSGTGRDAGGYRTEFLGLVKLAEPLLK
ncbi:MAG TPA: von Willebrand factor type A domain-containing protein [Opitutaceae bacterium]|nr:von Willebrand factor type A domain-containing protein [Opitutaceae bacterium]